MWFNSNRAIYEQLKKEIIENLPTEKQTIDLAIFNNGVFTELPSVKKWIQVLHGRELTSEYIKSKIENLRNICRGTLHGHDFVAEGKMSLKHPDRLLYADLLEVNAILKDLDIDTCAYKRDLKDFLENVREIPIGKKITVGTPKGKGKYAKLRVELSKLQVILNEVRELDFEAYGADLFMFKTATRVTATLKALIENITIVESEAVIRVYDKGRVSKYPMGHPWDKRIDRELLAVLTQIIGERKAGKIFANITDNDLAKINKQVIMKYAPELFQRYPDLSPNHFWRHMFAQIMLDQTEWNYAIVSALGGWTPQALEESYGKPPTSIVKQWSSKYKLTIAAALEKETRTQQILEQPSLIVPSRKRSA
jgi:hypothetical protein